MSYGPCLAGERGKLPPGKAFLCDGLWNNPKKAGADGDLDDLLRELQAESAGESAEEPAGNPLIFGQDSYYSRKHTEPLALHSLLEKLTSRDLGKVREAVRDLDVLFQTLESHATVPYAYLPTDSREQIDCHLWDLFRSKYQPSRQVSPEITFFADEATVTRVRKGILEAWESGSDRFVPIRVKEERGVTTFRYTDDDQTRYWVFVCTDASEEWSNRGMVKSFYPECGPKHSFINVKTFRSAYELVREALLHVSQLQGATPIANTPLNFTKKDFGMGSRRCR